MTKDKKDVSASRSGWFSERFPALLLLAGIILLAFGAVGLYEDREWLSRDLLLAVAGVILVGLSLPAIFKESGESESEESESEEESHFLDLFEVPGILFTIGCVGTALAQKTAYARAWWMIGIPLLTIYGLYSITTDLREKRQAALAEEPATESPDAAAEATADPEATDPPPSENPQ